MKFQYFKQYSDQIFFSCPCYRAMFLRRLIKKFCAMAFPKTALIFSKSIVEKSSYLWNELACMESLIDLTLLNDTHFPSFKKWFYFLIIMYECISCFEKFNFNPCFFLDVFLWYFYGLRWRVYIPLLMSYVSLKSSYLPALCTPLEKVNIFI